MFHSTADCAQLFIIEMTRAPIVTSASSQLCGPQSPPEASVTQMPFVGQRRWMSLIVRAAPP